MKTFIASLLLLTSLGCSRLTGNKDQQADHGKLNAFLKQTDRLIEKQYFTESHIDSIVKGPEKSGYVISTWIPGSIAILPIIATDVNGNKEKYKGARITVTSRTYSIAGTYTGETKTEKPDVHSSLLDEDELRDLNESMTYMLAKASAWKSSAPKVETEITFQSKDEFTVSTGISNGATVVLFQSGIVGKAGEVLPPDLASKLQEQLRQAIDVLSKN